MVEKIKKEKRRKVLVTGSSGMLGTSLCEKLSHDYDIVGLDVIKSTVHSPQSTVFIQCDITNRNKTIKSIVDSRPDLIIHIAAWTDVDGCERNPDKAKKINHEGTKNVAVTASKSNIPFLYISTDFVFDGHKKTPYTESDPTNPVNIYGRSKLEGEKEVEASKKYMILRTGWMYGKGGQNFVDTILNKTKTEKELKVVNDQIGSPTYTKDFARAIRKLLEVIRGPWTVDRGRIWGIYHISNKGAVSWFDYAKEILKISKVDTVKVLPMKSDQLGRLAKRPAFSVLDNTKFEKTTGFIMRPWKVALREYINEKG